MRSVLRVDWSALYLFSLLCLPTMVVGAAEPDGKKSLGGTGEMIQWALDGQSSEISGIEIHGSRYGRAEPPNERFLIYVLSADQSEVVATRMAPYALFERGEQQWVGISFSKPVVIPKDGWVVVDFRAGRTKGVYVSYSAAAEGQKSMIGLPGMEARETEFKGNWMIRPWRPDR